MTYTTLKTDARFSLHLHAIRIATIVLCGLCAIGLHAQDHPTAGKGGGSEHPQPRGGTGAQQPHDHSHHGHDHSAHAPKPVAKAVPYKPIRLPADVEDKMRRIVVQYGGRYMPLDTLAREFATSVWGSEKVPNQTHLDFLLQCTFQQATMEKHPMFKISNEKFRQAIELPASPSTGNRYSFDELLKHEPFVKHLQRVESNQSGDKPDDLDAKINDLKGQLLDFRSALYGQYVLLIPNVQNPSGPWHSIDWLAKLDVQRSPKYADLKIAWMAFGTAFAASDVGAMRTTADTLTMQLEDLPATFRPGKEMIEEELHYNDLAPYTKAWQLMLIGVVIALSSVFIKKAWCDVVTTVIMFGGFGLLTYGINLRWDIAGRFPAANMFESLLFLSWGAALFTIIGPVLLKNRIVTLTSAVIAGVALLLADVLPVSAFIKPVAPVLLNTYWMACHVPVIMTSYSILAIAVLVAHVQIIGEGIFGKKWKYAEATDKMLYWYVISGSLILITGILTGSLWAASSWGRYWGWDPKEVWSLVAFLGYMAILHTRLSRERVPMTMKLASLVLLSLVFAVCIKFLNFSSGVKAVSIAGGTFAGIAGAMVYFMLAKSRFATAAKSIIAFWLIIMTYVGVNYVLGTGLHSYGFGVGNVASKTMLVGGIDLSILGICAVLFYYRSGTKQSDNRQENND